MSDAKLATVSLEESTWRMTDAGHYTTFTQIYAGQNSAEAKLPSDEENDTADNWSTASVLSDDQSGSIPEDEKGDDMDDTASHENLEEKLKDAMDGLSQKSAQGRQTCLETIIKAFSKKYLYEFLTDRKITVSDAVGRCLKKGKGDELALAAKCISIMCIQLGQVANEVMTDICPILLSILADNSASLNSRGEDIVGVMEALESIFQLSLRKGDETLPNNSPDVCHLHCNALTAWCLLLTIAPQWLIDKLVLKYFSQLPDLMESNDMELRIVGGETIALFYELGREENEEFESDAMTSLCETLQRLSTESHKYWAKRDKRQQKSSFRDILRAVQEGEAPEVSIKFAKESLEIFSWAKKIQYSAFCHLLGSGVYQHLQWNPLVRDVFGLGSPLLVSSLASNKPTKWERNLFNAAAFKARTKARSKNRDKRSGTTVADD